MNESDRGMMMQVSHAHHAPQGATICTVLKHIGNEISVNCAGFIRNFRNMSEASTFLEMPWRDLEEMFLREDSQSLILLREDNQHPWRPSSRFDRRPFHQ